jgi:hypothetical protein
MKKKTSEGYFSKILQELGGDNVENNCKEDEVHVHHKDLTTTNNKRKNLKVMFIDDHKKLHIREKFDESDKEFEEWYDKK